MANDRPQIGANWLEDIIFLNKSTTEMVKPFQEAIEKGKEMREWEVEYSILTDDDMQGIYNKVESERSLFARDREFRKLVLAMSLKTINGLPVYTEDDFQRWKEKKGVTNISTSSRDVTSYDYKRELIGSWEQLVIDLFYGGYQTIVRKREEDLTGKIKKSLQPLGQESAGRLENDQDSTESSESETED